MRKLLSFLAMVFTIFAIVFFSVPSIGNANLGIEFKGGYEIVYNVSEKDGAELPAIEDIADVIANRIDIAGVKNPQVSVEKAPGEDKSFIRVCVSSKNTEELADVLSLIETDAEITFTDDEGNYLMGGDVLKETDGALLSYQDGMPIVLLNIADTKTFGEATGSIAGKNMIAWIGYQGPNDETGYVGDFAAAFKGEGTEEQQTMALKKIIVNATVNEAISSETAQITGSFTAEEASKIGKLLSAGNMDFVLERTDVLKVDGSYGESAFNKSMIAGLIGLLAIIAMMIINYKIPGVVASIVLVLYTALVIVVFNLIGGEYGPDTIAAIVIGLGMAVDACIILFERLGEELYKGRSVKAAYEESTKKSLSSILDSNITTIIAACALYFFGKRSVKGFATMLLITTVFNVVVMLIITRVLMFLLVKSGRLDNKKHLLGVKVDRIPDITKGESQTYFGKFNKVNFVKATKKVLIGLACVYGLGLGFAGGAMIYGAATGNTTYPLNFGLDFLPGATATINISDLKQFESNDNVNMNLLYEEKETESEESVYSENSVKKFLVDSLYFTEKELPTSVSVVKDYDAENEVWTLAIKLEFANIGTEDADLDFLTSFEDEVSTALYVEAVTDYEEYITISQQVSSPTMAKATVYNALLSLAVAFALMIVYISVRFRFTYAISSLVALFLDVVSMLAIFAIFRIEVQVEFVSAVLAIVGYSINNTVVIFDRIREIAAETNFGKLDEEGRYNIVNKAVQNCATRSFWTTISTILPVLALIFIGAEATIAFSIAMLVGLVHGIFTSMFIAPSLWLVLEKRHMRRLKEKAIKEAQNVGNKKSNGPEELTIVGIND